MKANTIFGNLEVTEGLDFEVSLTKDEKQNIVNTFKAASYDEQRYIMRFMVDQYYQSQQYRIIAENQARALMQGYDDNDSKEHPLFIKRTLRNAKTQEELNKKIIDVATDQIPVCKWMKEIKGIGPCISGYLFQAFDIRKVNYATEFLSYAGLNDNNNPWLGTEKATAMVKEALAERDMYFKPLQECFELWIEENLDPKLTKTKMEKFFKKAAEEYTTASLDEIAKTVYKKSPEKSVSWYYDNADTIPMYGYEQTFIKFMANEKRCDGILINYIAKQTGRKYDLVEQGVNNTWQAKKVKTPEPTVADLIAYLAKPPYNTDLKKMCYIIGDLFVKNAGRGSMYGKIYKKRLEEETYRNERREFAPQAMQLLQEKSFDKNKDTYKCLADGKLPPAHLIMRARRYAVKLFISHVFEAMYYLYRGETAPAPYIIAIGGHHDYIAPPVDFKAFKK